MRYSKKEIRQKIDLAIELLIKHDKYLLVKGLNERSVSHKLAQYLQEIFPEYDVDCEFNRNHDDIKRLNIPTRSLISDDIQATTVFPDIIVHKRGSRENLLVIEMKKTDSQERDDYDLGKLKAFIRELGYRFAAFIKIEVGVDAGCRIEKFYVGLAEDM